ncbi:hypothetical protein ABEF95_010335 [Exophiala dermatitidis]
MDATSMEQVLPTPKGRSPQVITTPRLPATLADEEGKSMATSNGANGHPNGDGEGGPLNTTEPLHRGAFLALLQDFSPIWFTWCMNAGIIAILMHQLPYQFDGLGVLSTIVFMFDFVLFIIFSAVYILLFAIFRGQAYRELVDDVSQLALFACWPIAWLTLVAFVSLTVSEAVSWGGHAFTLVAYVMWWIGTAWMMATLCFVIITLVRRHSISDQQLPPLVFIPSVGVATLATIGGLVSSFSHDISARLAVPVIIASFFAVGVGLLLATFLYTMLLHHLLTKGWPPPQQTASMFLFVGPMGQSAAALQLLGSAAHTYGRFEGYHKGAFLTETAAAPLEVACIMTALLLSGMGTVWLMLAVWAMAERAFQKELSWTPTWNAIIFPTGTLTTSMLMFSIEMDSPFFHVITTLLLLLMILMFFVNLAATLWEIYQGRLLVIKENPRAKKEIEERHKSH